MSARQLARLRPQVGPREQIALDVWGVMGQRPDWGAYQLLADLHELSDPETLLTDLLTLNALTPPAP